MGDPPQSSPARALIGKARDRLRPMIQRAVNESPFPTQDWATLFERCDAWLEAQNNNQTFDFLSEI
jgi:hypothetical protein